MKAITDYIRLRFKPDTSTNNLLGIKIKHQQKYK